LEATESGTLPVESSQKFSAADASPVLSEQMAALQAQVRMINENLGQLWDVTSALPSESVIRDRLSGLEDRITDVSKFLGSVSDLQMQNLPTSDGNPRPSTLAASVLHLRSSIDTVQLNATTMNTRLTAIEEKVTVCGIAQGLDSSETAAVASASKTDADNILVRDQAISNLKQLYEEQRSVLIPLQEQVSDLETRMKYFVQEAKKFKRSFSESTKNSPRTSGQQDTSEETAERQQKHQGAPAPDSPIQNLSPLVLRLLAEAGPTNQGQVRSSEAMSPGYLRNAAELSSPRPEDISSKLAFLESVVQSGAEKCKELVERRLEPLRLRLNSVEDKVESVVGGRKRHDARIEKSLEELKSSYDTLSQNFDQVVESFKQLKDDSPARQHRRVHS
jgi:archaellum component FlaC